MEMKKIGAAVFGAFMIVASTGAAFAQAAGGTGNTGNENNDPAAIQQDSTGAVQGGTSGGMMGDKTTNSGMKPGKDCGMRGENQGNRPVDSQRNCE